MGGKMRTVSRDGSLRQRRTINALIVRRCLETYIFISVLTHFVPHNFSLISSG